MKEIRQIPVQAIYPDKTQPRKDFNEEGILELAWNVYLVRLLRLCRSI